jgi:hypothetical protein
LNFSLVTKLGSRRLAAKKASVRSPRAVATHRRLTILPVQLVSCRAQKLMYALAA